MTFKVGDKVRYKSGYGTSNPAWAGVEAVVEECSRVTTRAKITKDNAASWAMGFCEGVSVRTMTSNLELKKLTKEDFPVGTKVKINRASYTGETGKVDCHTSRYIRVLLDGFKHGDRLFAPEELEIIEEKEPELTYNVGDKIEFVQNHEGKARAGDTATVIAPGVGPIWDTHGDTAVSYKLDKNGATGRCFLRRVKPTPAFTFKDIQEGDTIRRTETWETGTVQSVEGVVVNLNNTLATTKETLVVGHYRDALNKHLKLELVNRPEKPKAPELWENREPGDKIAAYSKNGSLERILTKREDGLWDTLVVNTNGALQRGYERSDEEVGMHITKHSDAAKAHLVK